MDFNALGIGMLGFLSLMNITSMVQTPAIPGALGLISGGEKQGSCACSVDVIPRFQLEWEMLKRCLGSSLGPWQCLCHPSVPKKHPQHQGTELQLAGRQPGLCSGSCQATFYGALHLFYGGYQQLCVSKPVCSQRGRACKGSCCSLHRWG